MSEPQMQWRVAQFPPDSGLWVIQERVPETLMPMRGEMWAMVSIQFESMEIAYGVLEMMQVIRNQASIVLSLTQ